MKNILKGLFTKKEVATQKTLLETVEQNANSLCIVGAAGTGKTIALGEMAAEAMKRDENVFIFDHTDAAADVNVKIVEFLSTEVPAGRTLFVFDEFGYTGAIPAIMPLLCNARKYKATTAIAFSDLSKIEKVYGKNTAQGIINSCNNFLVFNCGVDTGTAEYFAQSLGIETVKTAGLPKLTGYLKTSREPAELRTVELAADNSFVRAVAAGADPTGVTFTEGK